MNKNYRDLFEDSEIAVAKKLVNEFRRMLPCLQREGFEDLLQECLVHWLSAKETYDPAREASKSTFMGRIIRNKLTDLVREREADKRKLAHITSSLDEHLGNEDDPDALVDTIADTNLSPILQIEMKIDLSQVLKRLTPKQKKLCHLLGNSGISIKDASERLKTPRSTIYDEIERIRRIFMKEGLNEYLK